MKLIVSTNAGENMGGEAMKAFQFFKYLIEIGENCRLITHARCRKDLEDKIPAELLIFIEDDALQRFLWKSRILRFLLNTYFHLKVRGLVERCFADDPDLVVHYIGPVSPVEPRHQSSKGRTVMGPLTGNIGYPPAFAFRDTILNRLRHAAHHPVQRLFGRIFGDKRRAAAILVSGYERTRESLLSAGASDSQMIDVVDAGVSPTLAGRPRVTHDGRNPVFMASGRFVDHKGLDLAIKAVAAADPDIRLEVFGDGPMGRVWRGLAESLGVADRVRFHGWAPYDVVLEHYSKCRGYVFPSLAEANGIVMQEAMMIGLPVITLRWGGPAHLADDDSAMYIDPLDERSVVVGLAAAMNRLAAEGALADAISRRARDIAERRFSWENVARSWFAAYAR